MKLNKKWFTLVEMLIVIVIIGILAAALIPRLTGVQGRARDVARKASIQQVWSALATYNLDTSAYPDTTGYGTWLSKLTTLMPIYLKSLPKDPGGNDYNISNNTMSGTNGDFLYVKLAEWYAVMSMNEWGWVGANRASASGASTLSGWALQKTTSFNLIKACDQVSQWVTLSNMLSGWNCTADLAGRRGRYMVYAD